MDSVSPLRRRRPAKVAHRAPSARSFSWYARKRPALLFVAKFAGLVVIFYVLSLLPVCERAQSAYLRAVAGTAHSILRHFGQEAQLAGDTIWSPMYAVTVGRQCSAVEIAWFLAAAMLAFPASGARKIWGILAGLLFLATLNTIRVGTLYAIGVHAPSFFVPMHENVWPGLLIIASLGFMTLWIGQAPSHEPGKTHVSS